MDHLDRRQLEVLYGASGRRVRELETALTAMREEGERERGALRHELRTTREEKNELASHLSLLEEGGSQLRGVVSQLQEELVREKERVEDAEREKEEVLQQLQAAQSTVSNLTTQVSSL